MIRIRGQAGFQEGSRKSRLQHFDLDGVLFKNWTFILVHDGDHHRGRAQGQAGRFAAQRTEIFHRQGQSVLSLAFIIQSLEERPTMMMMMKLHQTHTLPLPLCTRITVRTPWLVSGSVLIAKFLWCSLVMEYLASQFLVPGSSRSVTFTRPISTPTTFSSAVMLYYKRQNPQFNFNWNNWFLIKFCLCEWWLFLVSFICSANFSLCLAILGKRTFSLFRLWFFFCNPWELILV